MVSGKMLALMLALVALSILAAGCCCCAGGGGGGSGYSSSAYAGKYCTGNSDCSNGNGWFCDGGMCQKSI